jgi:hypothetical protein
VVYQFGVGETVLTTEGTSETLVKATIIAVNEDGTFTVEFEDGTTEIKLGADLKIYYGCGGCDDINLAEIYLCPDELYYVELKRL